VIRTPDESQLTGEAVIVEFSKLCTVSWQNSNTKRNFKNFFIQERGQELELLVE
jgi:hypothetical protein